MNALQNAKGLEFVGFSKVWNYHGIAHLEAVASNKKSNLYKEIEKLRESGYKGMVTLFVSCIGRSQHSASKVEIYKGVTNNEECSIYYTKRHGEIKI